MLLLCVSEPDWPPTSPSLQILGSKTFKLQFDAGKMGSLESSLKHLCADVEAAVKATMEADAGSRSLKAAAQAEAEAAAAVDDEPGADLGEAPADGAEAHGDPGLENTDPAAAGGESSKAGKRPRGAGAGAEQKGGKTPAAGKRRKSLLPPPAGRKIDSFFGKVTAP